MSYLFELVRSLNETDKLRLENLPLIGKEREVMDYLMYRKENELDVPHACKALALSRSHFDKISSVVLAKVYSDFFSEGNNTAIVKLTTRGLLRHALHLAKQVEKGWEKAPPPKTEARNFYETVFRTVCRMPAQTENKLGLVSQYAKRYVVLVDGEKEKAIASIFTKSRSLICEIENAGVMKQLNSPASKKRFEKKLVALKQDSDKTKSAYAIYCANIANIFYFNILEPSRSIPFLEEGMKLMPKLKHDLNDSERNNFHLKYGECLFFLSRFEDAFVVFEKYVRHEASHAIMVNAMRSKYIQLCIITGRLHDAEIEMQYVYAKTSEEQVHSFTLMYVLNSIKLYLLKADYERAFDYLQLIKNRITKNLLVNYEVELRNLEAAYFFLMGDFNFALYLAKKNLKFFSSRKEMRETPEVGNFSRLLSKMVAATKKKTAYDFRNDALFEMYTQRELAYYEKVLEVMSGMT